MKLTKLVAVVLLIIAIHFLPQNSFAQQSDVDLILSQRAASNAALKTFDEELNNTFMTDDVLITTGAGTLISGKKELNKYIKNAKGPRMYWIRTAGEIIVNPKTQLAWETGIWKGYVEGSSQSVVGGKYSAQWTKKSGTWLIQSQLFVTLEKE
jgi:ketosteroid isomerase-like protein